MTDTSYTPTLADIIVNAINKFRLDLNTCLPGKILSYDRNTQTAVVQTCIKRKFIDRDYNVQNIDLPPIYNVPVQFPANSKVHIHFDLEPEDSVLLVFSQRSIDRWNAIGGCVETENSRLHDLTDAFAIPGVKPKAKPFEIKGEEGSIVINNDGNFIELQKSGKVAIRNQENELIDILSTLIEEMISGTNETAMGPFPKSPAFLSALAELKIKMDTFKV